MWLTCFSRRSNDEFVFFEGRTYNWEDTPNFYTDGDTLYLYCGNDKAILSVLPDAISVRNFG